MADNAASSLPAPPRRRRWPYVLTGLALLVVAVLVAIPYLIRWQTLVWLHDNGQQAAEIADVDFNPFSGRLALLALGGGTSEGEALDLDQVAVQVDWLPLLKRRVMVADIAMDRVTLDVRREPDGALVVGRLALPPPAQDGQRAPAAPAPPWLLGLGKVDLRDVTIRYSDALLDTRVRLKRLHLDPALQWEPERPTAFRAELELDGEQWTLEGTAKPFAAAPSLDARVRLQGRVQRRYPRLLASLGVESLTLEANTDAHLQARFDPATGELDLRHQSRLELGQLALATPTIQGELERLGWDGTIVVAGTASAPRVVAEGSFTLAGLHLARPDPRLEGILGELRWQGTVRSETGSEGGPVQVEANGSLGLRGVRVSELEGPLASLGLEELGLELAPLHVTIPADTPPTVEHHGTLRWNGAGAEHTAPALKATQGNLVWDGDLRFAPGIGTAAPELQATGSLGAERLSVSNPDSGLGLLQLDRFQAEGVAVTAPDQASVATLALEGLRALQNAPQEETRSGSAGPGHVLTLARFLADRIAVDGAEQVGIGRLQLEDLEARLTRNADGVLAFREALPAPATEPAPPSPGEPSPPTRLQLGEAHLVGENRVVYRDHTVEPTYEFEVAPFELHLEGVDSRDPSALSPLSLQARSGRYATLAVDGEVGLFAARPTLHLTGEVRGIDLAQATPLAQRYTGYRIRSGLLDADLRVDADQGALDSLTELTANKLEMVKLDPDALDQLDQELGLPLNAALDLLRDSDDNIQLKIPVQGDLSNPDIQIGDAVRKALLAGTAKAVSTGALTYLATLGAAVFVPVGAAMAAGKVLSLATALRFEPIPFEPAADRPDPAAREQLDTLAELLAARPKLRITLCPFAAPGDRAALQQRARPAPPPPPPAPPAQAPGSSAPAPLAPPAPPEIPVQQLLDLATRRGEAAKLYLVEERGVDPGRLFVCSPEWTEAEGALPRLEVSL